MNVPIRVFMITSEWPSPEHPHAAPYIVRQVDFLRRVGVDVEVFAFRGAKNPMNYMKAWRQVHQKLKQKRYDLIHAQFGQSGLLALPKRVPFLVTFHGTDVQGDKRPDGRLTFAGKVLQRVSQLVALRADAVIIVSDNMRKDLPSSVSAPILPTGIDLDFVACVPKEEARSQLGFPLTERLILFVGDPASVIKRYDLARQAVAIVNKTLPAKLIVGCRMTNREIILLMNACDVLVVTSLHEGSPAVVKEALACNLPIVSVAVGDVPLRLQNIEGCEVCSDDRPETISASLERVLRRGQRIRGRETVKNLDEKVLTEKLISIYRSIMATNKRR